MAGQPCKEVNSVLNAVTSLAGLPLDAPENDLSRGFDVLANAIRLGAQPISPPGPVVLANALADATTLAKRHYPDRTRFRLCLDVLRAIYDAQRPSPKGTPECFVANAVSIVDMCIESASASDDDPHCPLSQVVSWLLERPTAAMTGDGYPEPVSLWRAHIDAIEARVRREHARWEREHPQSTENLVNCLVTFARYDDAQPRTPNTSENSFHQTTRALLVSCEGDDEGTYIHSDLFKFITLYLNAGGATIATVDQALMRRVMAAAMRWADATGGQKDLAQMFAVTRDAVVAMMQNGVTCTPLPILLEWMTQICFQWPEDDLERFLVLVYELTADGDGVDPERVKAIQASGLFSSLHTRIGDLRLYRHVGGNEVSSYVREMLYAAFDNMAKVDPVAFNEEYKESFFPY